MPFRGWYLRLFDWLWEIAAFWNCYKEYLLSNSIYGGLCGPWHSARTKWSAMGQGGIPSYRLLIRIMRKSYCQVDLIGVAHCAHAMLFLSELEWKEWLPAQYIRMGYSINHGKSCNLPKYSLKRLNKINYSMPWFTFYVDIGIRIFGAYSLNVC